MGLVRRPFAHITGLTVNTEPFSLASFMTGTARLDAVAAKRGQILAGARQVFGELGFERASVDLIAARAGVSKATIYNHYDDKNALFVACATQEVEELRAGLAA